MMCFSGEMTGEGMWLDTQHGEMIQGSFDNGTVTGLAVWERGDGVRFEGVFRHRFTKQCTMVKSSQGERHSM